MATYKCTVGACSTTVDSEFSARNIRSPSDAAKECVERLYMRGELDTTDDEWRVVVTDESGNVSTFDVHLEGIELDLSAMEVRA